MLGEPEQSTSTLLVSTVLQWDRLKRIARRMWRDRNGLECEKDTAIDPSCWQIWIDRPIGDAVRLPAAEWCEPCRRREAIHADLKLARKRVGILERRLRGLALRYSKRGDDHMRTPFDELTEQELIALPPEEIDFYVDLACAEAGVKLLPPPPIAPTTTRPLPDQTLFKLNHEDLRFTDRGAALRVVDAINAAAKAGHVFTEAYVHLGGSHYEKKASPFVDRLDVSELQLFSEKAAQQHGAALEECARANETYQTNKREYDQAVAERLSLNKRIQDKIEAAKGAESRRARMRAEFQRYLALAEGRRAVAANFLKSAHPTAPELLPDLFNIDEVAEAVGRPRAYQREDVQSEDVQL